jgi:hypothetical protein
MNEVKTSKVESMFSLSEIKNSAVSFIKESLIQIEKILPFKGITDREPVDNYLKSPEEIEAEFSFVMNTRRTDFDGRNDRFESYGRTINNTDGYLNIMNSDQSTEFMEENY